MDRLEDERDEPPPKQWEIRAALRAYSRVGERVGEEDGRHPAEQILSAGLELVREQSDFTVKQLSERAGIALQTFYRHFGTKDELLLAMLEENISRGTRGLLSEADAIGDPLERLHRLVTAPIVSDFDESGRRMLQWAARERQRLTARFPQAVFAVHLPYRAAVQQAIEAIVEAGRGSSADAALDAAIIQHEVMLLTHLTHGGGLDRDPETVAERAWELIHRGLAGRVSPTG